MTNTNPDTKTGPALKKPLGRVGYLAAQAIKSARQEKKNHEEEEKASKEIVNAILGDVKVGTWQGVDVVRVVTVNTNKFDEKSFKEDYPELHAQYVKAGSYPQIKIL